ncbi:VOC family protein [Candidatus Enterococcus willemsii]|uniref:Glyoxalase n=1 Tax=Candidatus Enterococcus willemsii TaxID=1857215 RepID=A0ABQ6YY72_9ENTE|nr:VOC family protein [Enterococcus sp. CU12B]KAF1302837.1 glyoxalase [Enterococcus sp. CU12B]
MSTMVFVNFPVKDVAASTVFYEKLGFKKNDDFSDERTSCMVWDDNFFIMLLDHSFYKLFIKDKTIADTKTQSAALIAFSLGSADEVKKFGKLAEESGGTVYSVDMGIPEDQMFGLEVQDLDGNMLEPNWMAM